MRLRPAQLAPLPLPLLLLALDASPRAHARMAPACTLVGADSLTSVPGRPFQALPSADGRTVVLTNFASQTVQLVDLTRLP